MKPAKQPDLIPCGHCGTLITPGRDRRRKWCSNACKMRAYRDRKEQREKMRKAGMIR